MRFILLIGSLAATAAAINCPKGWKGSDATKFCYLHVDNADVTQPQAEAACIKMGAHLTGINSKEENEFLKAYAKLGTAINFAEQPWIGLEKKGNAWKWIDGSTGNGYQWGPYEPNNQRKGETCVKVCDIEQTDLCDKKKKLIADPVNSDDGKLYMYSGKIGVLNDTPCDRPSSRYICRRKESVKANEVVATPPITTTVKPVVKQADEVPAVPEVCDVNAKQSATGCECNKGFTDILSTTIPEKNLYMKKGMKCIATDPCKLVTEPISIIFVVDSSGSIGATGWTDLLSFIEKAAPLMPKKSRVGFVKYSQRVTANFWLKDGWTEQEFLSSIPRKYDGSITMTDEGLGAAVDLLKDDKNKKQTVVLFTDGMPSFPAGMKSALAELKSTKAKLLVMGFGASISQGRAQIATWLDKPQQDYFAYHEATKLLTSDHMKNILTKVCQQ